jgi:hypothetical protein
MFFDLDASTCTRPSYETVTCFWPMWAGIASEEQSSRMMRGALPKFEVAGGKSRVIGFRFGLWLEQASLLVPKPVEDESAWTGHRGNGCAFLHIVGGLRDSNFRTTPALGHHTKCFAGLRSIVMAILRRRSAARTAGSS